MDPPPRRSGVPCLLREPAETAGTASHVTAPGSLSACGSASTPPPRSPGRGGDPAEIEGLPPYSVRPPETPFPGDGERRRLPLMDRPISRASSRGTCADSVNHAASQAATDSDGRFYFKPLRAVNVGPVHVSVARGGVYAGERPMAEALDGSVHRRARELRPAYGRWRDIIHRLSLDCDAAVTFADVGELPRRPRRLDHSRRSRVAACRRAAQPEYWRAAVT